MFPCLCLCSRLCQCLSRTPLYVFAQILIKSLEYLAFLSSIFLAGVQSKLLSSLQVGSSLPWQAQAQAHHCTVTRMLWTRPASGWNHWTHTPHRNCATTKVSPVAPWYNSYMPLQSNSHITQRILVRCTRLDRPPNNALDIPTSQSEAHDHDPTLTPPELPGDLVKNSSTRQSKTTPMPSRQTWYVRWGFELH